MVSKILDVPVVVEKDADGYYAFCPSLQGCYTQGDTYEEVMKNLIDVIKLHIEERTEEGEEIEVPESVSLTSVKVEVDA
jgi:predicted RNase H-like HicB family nuclease